MFFMHVDFKNIALKKNRVFFMDRGSIYFRMSARPHVGKDNIQLLNDFGDTFTPEITIICQQPLSPEVNVHSLSKRCQKSECNSLDELWNNVQNYFTKYPADTLQALFDVKCSVIQEIIRNRAVL